MIPSIFKYLERKMLPLYNVNGLVHFSEREINARERMTQFFSEEIKAFLRGQNKAWEIERVEAPIMLPTMFVNPNYTKEDLWVFQKNNEDEVDMVARPETTSSTYAYMVHRLSSHSGINMPYCSWQLGKSFRNEQDKVLSHMRLKEFYQLEFQCAYSSDTMNDYHTNCLEPVRAMIQTAVNLPTRLVESDRLPDYSLITMDVEVDMGKRWMELCSISKRNDFPIKNKYFNKKKEEVEKDVLVLEIAIGMDRCVSAWNHSQNKE